MASQGGGNGKRHQPFFSDRNRGGGDASNRHSSHGPPNKRPRVQGPSEAGRQQGRWGQTPRPASSAFNLGIQFEISVQKFAQSRARELDALSRAVEYVGGAKLSFQRLPKHMRRRAMSHDIRRIPRRLRLKAQAELEKREKKSVSKRPSRRYRRRPGNLLLEYQRRQRRNIWLETHIWHAKRFKMTTAWGYRLPLHPSDKSLRACYRATAHHCLLQDVSYECCIEMRGQYQSIIDALSHVCSKDTGLTFAAKATASGQRWGQVTLYTCDAYPHHALAPVSFLWQPEEQSSENNNSLGPDGARMDGNTGEKESRLWMWCPPAAYSAVWTQLSQACVLTSPPTPTPAQTPQRSESQDSQVSPEVQSANALKVVQAASATELAFGQLRLRSLKDQFVKLRLTGPASNLVLSETLKIANVDSQSQRPNSEDDGGDTMTSKFWWQDYYADEEHNSQFTTQEKVWQVLTKCQTPDEVPPRAAVALTVKDPRVLLPAVRTKVAREEAESTTEVVNWEHLPLTSVVSPLWGDAVRTEVAKTKMTEQELNKRRSQLLVPGSAVNLGDAESRIPILLLQRPGSQSASSRDNPSLRTGVSSGWDLVAPKGWSMAFWVAMVYRGARVGGLREARSLSTRSGLLHFPHDFPDCSAGLQQQRESRDEAIDKHVRRPPAKRVNYSRLGAPAPFHCPFARLVKEWLGKVPELLNLTGTNASSASGEALLNKELDEAAVIQEVSVKEKSSTEKEKQNDSSLSSNGDRSNTGSDSTQSYVLRCRRLLLGLQEAVQGGTQKRNVNRKAQNNVGSRLSSFLSPKHRKDLVTGHLHSLVPIATACLCRGVPSGHAMICLPSAADLELLAKDSSFGGPEESLHQRSQTKPDKVKMAKKKKGTVVVKSTPTVAENKVQSQESGKSSDSKDAQKSLNAKQLEEKAHFLKEPSRILDACDRPIIGFLTDGDFDLGQGHGSGIGFCSLVGLLSALKGSNVNKPFLVLLRNPMSRQYRFAHLSVLT